MKRSVLLAATCTLLMFTGYSQNIGINTDASKPDKNAILDIKSDNKGVLIPRMDSVTRKKIPNTKGLLVYDITTDNFWYNTGKEWKCMPDKDDHNNQNGDAWLLKGNNNTKDGVNFLGTTNNVPLSIRVNNQPSGRIDSARGSAFWGYRAGSIDTGSGNTAIGAFALQANTSGTSNTANGNQSLNSNTIGYENTANGLQALYSNTTGWQNTADGAFSLYSNTTGNLNTAHGIKSLYSNTTGLGNTANGAFTLKSNDIGMDNTATGSLCLFFNTNGSSNTATGYLAMYTNTIGNFNTANGFQALSANKSGNNNTASGWTALLNNTIGNYNVANGVNALSENRGGEGNTADGSNSLSTNFNGSYNTAIGFNADVSISNLTNATALGNSAIVDASNKVRIGNSAVTVIEGQVPFTTPSDGRYKFNVRENVKGLDFILQLRPVTYQFDVKRFDAQMNHKVNKTGAAPNYAIEAAYDQASQIRRTGFIAQEVEQAANASGYDFSGIIKPKTDQDHYSLSYEAFVVPLVKAVQEQQQVIVLQNAKIKEQDKRLASLERELTEIKNSLNINH